MFPKKHLENFSRLEQLTEIARALALERDLTRLFEAILMSAKRVTHADGGTFYYASEDGKTLNFNLVLNESLKLHLGGTSKTPVTIPPMALYDAQGEPNHHSVVAHCALTRKSVRIDDAYRAQGFDFRGAKEFDAKNHYRSQSFLTVPMLSHDEQLIGVLQLINARDARGKTIPFSEPDQRFIEAVAAQAAIALENHMLVEHMEKLFLSFINLINVAIDEKSPHTGGHCQRVPELTMMIADAAAATTSGPLADFHMSERDRKELLIAGLMHDCGKITTPVHVIDKSTKLQTIIDRIEMIDARFEVLKRDAEINALHQKLSGEDAAQVDAQLAQELAALSSDQEFLHFANIGQEKMLAADQERVVHIGKRTWRGAQGTPQPLLNANEIENLTVPYGTLTKSEREMINHHIVLTIKMLEALPWPKHLRNVPEYAGGHHERMDGKGYPRGLTREQMSVQARVMGIADIFEALTAKDRPYKVGKTLTESLTILGRMAESGHVDPDLFKVFVAQKVYLQFAERFLDAEQIDQVDESQIPGYQF